MPTEDLVINRVHSSTTATPGRASNQVRDHQLLIDEPTHLGGPGEQITPAEAFLTGVAACGALMVQGRARDIRIGLNKVDVDLEAVRHRRDTSVFDHIDMRFHLSGPSMEQAQGLVDHYKTH
jgi:uncharacterized OsmC-like protein